MVNSFTSANGTSFRKLYKVCRKTFTCILNKDTLGNAALAENVHRGAGTAGAGAGCQMGATTPGRRGRKSAGNSRRRCRNAGPGAYPDTPEPSRPPVYAYQIAAGDSENLEGLWVATAPPNSPTDLLRLRLFYCAIGPGARPILLARIGIDPLSPFAEGCR